jgi:hypothetical protein
VHVLPQNLFIKIKGGVRPTVCIALNKTRLQGWIRESILPKSSWAKEYEGKKFAIVSAKP